MGTFPEYTETDGNTGLLDQILLTLKVHLQEEFDQQRIKGADYAKVYLGLLEAAMGNTTQYLLGNALLEEQRAKLLAEVAIAEAQVINITKQNEKIDAEIVLMGLEVDKLNFQINYLFPAELLKIQNEADKIANEAALIVIQGTLVTAEIAKINAEISLLAVQETNLGKQGEKIDAEIAKITADIAFLAVQEANLVKEGEKIDAEVAFLLV